MPQLSRWIGIGFLQCSEYGTRKIRTEILHRDRVDERGVDWRSRVALGGVWGCIGYTGVGISMKKVVIEVHRVKRGGGSVKWEGEERALAFGEHLPYIFITSTPPLQVK
ncbi:hypothetical protein BDQ17DRAFT_1332479 [Cyathus striatus]|nr:hypothetical protein BDQ17DRAFT_1332479 [Cyathus striatus]